MYHLYACRYKETILQYVNIDVLVVSLGIFYGNKKIIPHKQRNNTTNKINIVISPYFPNNKHKYVLPIIHPPPWITITIHGVHYYNSNKENNTDR